ncbi:MAG: alpha-hydroxy-acid oxidizing protein [Candidatus Wallbacteria bacterium]|nr:alpha-hydroxy-acid oxidizing protein [Candidatus Wallbacteria bacterium]
MCAGCAGRSAARCSPTSWNGRSSSRSSDESEARVAERQSVAASSPAARQRHIQHIRRGLETISAGAFDVPDAVGNLRWTEDLLLSTWEQAATGRPPVSGREFRVGRSGGGFDRIHFRFLRPAPVGPPAVAAGDLAIPLNRRSSGPRIEIPLPVYGAGFSFGSVSLQVMLSRARAAERLGSYTSTGEGGYPLPLAKHRERVITQVATGLFGVHEETIQWAPILEIKYAQGAKPGLGGHLLGNKVTMDVANMRGSVPWVSLFSPFPFHSVYSVEDHRKHVDWLRTVNPRALVSVKVSTPTDVEMVAVGIYHAGAHIIHLDGSYGGTGAAPEIAKKNIAMPIEYAIPKVHRQLLEEGIRDEVVLMASGGVRTAWDVAKAIALGADGCVIGTAELVAMGCTQCKNCELGRGCPFGLTTTDPELSQLIEPDWAAERVVNLYESWKRQWRELLWRLELGNIRQLRGRADLMFHEEYERK